MLAVEKLKRISAALLRHSTSRHHYMTSSPPGGEVKDTQGQNGGGTLRAVHRRTPQVDDHCSAVVPISVCHSASLLPVTPQNSHGLYSDDVITPTNERLVTSFGDDSAYWLGDGDWRRNTTTSRNYFDAANKYNRTVNVNGVCFSVYGTLPRNLIRRRGKQGQGHVQGQTEIQGRSFCDALPDEVWTPRRQPAPSPPKRTNSIKTSVQQSLENDLETTLTRQRRESIPEVSDKAMVDNEVRVRKIITGTEPEHLRRYSATENENSLPFSDENFDTVKRTTTLTDSSVGHRDEYLATSENGENTRVVLDSGTVKHQDKFPDSQHMLAETTQNDLGVSPDVAALSSKDLVVLDQDSSKNMSVLDQELDDGTLKRRRKYPTDTSTRPQKFCGSQNTSSVTTHHDLEVSFDVAAVSSHDVVVLDQESSKNVAVLDQESDGGTLKRRRRSPTRLTRHLTTEDHQQVKDDAVDVSDEDDVLVLDQEFDAGTVKRRQGPPADDSSQLRDSVTFDNDFW